MLQWSIDMVRRLYCMFLHTDIVNALLSQNTINLVYESCKLIYYIASMNDHKEIVKM